MSAGAALALILPWAAAAPHAFWQGLVSYNVNLAPRRDSLSLYLLAHRLPGVGYPLLIAVAVAAVVAAVWLLPRNAFGFLAGSTLVMAAYNLCNKQSFFNQWELVGGLLSLTIAAAIGGLAGRSLRPPRVAATPVPAAAGVGGPPSPA